MKESEKIEKILDLARELKKSVEHLGDDDSDCSWCTWNGLQNLGKRTGKIGNQRKNRDHSEGNTVKIGWNTEKGPGNLN